MTGPVLKSKYALGKAETEAFNEATFEQYETLYPNFIACNAEAALEMFKDAEILFLDTEDKPLEINSNSIQPPHIRKWIGTGKTAAPVDVPFCISIGDGTNFVTVYDDDNEGGYPEIMKLKPLLENPNIEKVFHNIKFDVTMLGNIGITLKGPWHDTMIIAKLCDENLPNFTCEGLSKPIGGIDTFEQMVRVYKARHKIKSYAKINRRLMTMYANADIHNCYKIFEHYYPMLISQELDALYLNEMAIVKMAYSMEHTGMLVDLSAKEDIIANLQAKKDKAEQTVYDIAGKVFNMNSGKQLHQVLLDLGVKDELFSYSEKGNVKLDKIEMAKFAGMGVDIVKYILECKQAEKLLTTYAMGIYSQADAEGNVHANINTGEASTGRMSVTKPALQTLPKGDKTIRSMFIPPEGYDMWAMDLDQIEYRLFAHYSEEEALCEQIKKGYDIHRATASLVFGVPYEQVTDKERKPAKTLNFSLLYGQGIKALSESLGVSQTEANDFKNRYFSGIPKAKPFVDNVQRAIRRRGFIFNHYKRRRRLTKNECFKAPNALIQGCAADYIKHKAIDMFKYCELYNVKIKWHMFVHDEILFSVHKDDIEHIPVLRWLMSDFTQFRTHITAGVEQCVTSWGDKLDRGDELGFKALSDEEMKAVRAYNIWDGGSHKIYTKE